MGKQLFPTTDNGLLGWSAAFSTLISASPGDYGLTAALAAKYAALHDAFAAAMAASSPNFRCRSTVAAKNAARAALKTTGRRLVSLVNGTEGVTAAQKIELGLNVRGAGSPVPRPDGVPRLRVMSVVGWTVKVRLGDSAVSGRRGKPVGVSGASVFTFVGATPPTELSAWRFEGNASRVGLDLTFPSSNPPGTQVWLTAFWFNERKQSGPPCAPVTTNLQGGSVSMAA